MKQLMEQTGFDPRRLRYEVIGIPHAAKFEEEMGKMYALLRELGDNPLQAAAGNGTREASWLTK